VNSLTPEVAKSMIASSGTPVDAATTASFVEVLSATTGPLSSLKVVSVSWIFLPVTFVAASVVNTKLWK
jgi:hypothetical protein